ncbi:MAG TPA: HD domain-containing protein [Thermomicrobiaceae bacterium]|nr:HD domain-containing protein [Thermomicrobiaceae bacterium]
MSVFSVPAGSVAARVVYRTRQGLAHLRPQRAGAVDAELAGWLSPAQLGLVARLTAADRAHLLRAGRRAATLSADPDLVLAALLHDVGKADERTRVRLWQRVLVVLLGRVAPDLLARLARPSHRPWRRGFYLALAHPRLGAEMARASGASARACWLIAHHHDASVTDPTLTLLRQIDEEA